MKYTKPIVVGLALTSCVLCASCSNKSTIANAENFKINNVESLTSVKNFKKDFNIISSSEGTSFTRHGNSLVSYFQSYVTNYAIYSAKDDTVTFDKIFVRPTLITTYSRDYVYVPNTDNGGSVYQFTNGEWKVVEGLTGIEEYTFNEYKFELDNIYYEEWKVTDINGVSKSLYFKNVNGVKSKLNFDFLQPSKIEGWYGDPNGSKISNFYLTEDATPGAIMFGPEMENYMVDSRKNDDGTLEYILIDTNQKVTTYTLNTQDLCSISSMGRYGFLQYLVPVDNDSDSYDVANYEKDLKYKLTTYTIDYKTGKTKKIKCKYILGMGSGDGVGLDNYDRKKGVADIMVMDISNKQLDSSGYKYATITRKGKITISKHYYKDYYKLNNNRYIGVKDDKYYLLDGKKSVIADFSKTTNISMSSDTIRVIYDNRAYILDYNGVTLKEFEVPTGLNAGVTDYYNDTMIVTRRIETAGGGVYLEYNRIDKDNKVTCIGIKDIAVSGSETKQTKYGTADVLDITIKNGYYIVETTSETSGNRVYTFYTYDGKELGSFDLTVLSMSTSGSFSYRYGNVIFVKLGENCYKLNLK